MEEKIKKKFKLKQLLDAKELAYYNKTTQKFAKTKNVASIVKKSAAALSHQAAKPATKNGVLTDLGTSVPQPTAQAPNATDDFVTNLLRSQTKDFCSQNSDLKIVGQGVHCGMEMEDKLADAIMTVGMVADIAVIGVEVARDGIALVLKGNQRALANLAAKFGARQLATVPNGLTDRIDDDSELIFKIESEGGAKLSLRDAEEASASNVLVNSGLRLGENIDGLGTVAENIGAKITGYTAHGEERLAERGLTKAMLDKVVSDPMVTIKQSGGTMYYLTEDAAVILNSTGQVVTTYSKNEFFPKVIELLNRLK